jgi:hypothetical protein
MNRNRFVGAVLASTWFAIGGAPWALAQTAAPNVHWTASAKRDPADVQTNRATLDISAVVPEGWHIYALNQLAGGPTPLHVAIEAGAAAQITGVASGTTPEKRHDPSFDLDTEFYSHAFTLHFPVESRLSLEASPSLPVSVRFQLCSERECQPQKTIHLLASVDGVTPT